MCIPQCRSKSTDKLALLLTALERVPERDFNRVLSFTLEWEEISDGGDVFPIIKIELK